MRSSLPPLTALLLAVVVFLAGGASPASARTVKASKGDRVLREALGKSATPRIRTKAGCRRAKGARVVKLSDPRTTPAIHSNGEAIDGGIGHDPRRDNIVWGSTSDDDAIVRIDGKSGLDVVIWGS